MMKKYKIILAFMVVLSGCAKNNLDNTAEIISVDETTESTESTTEPDYLEYDDPFILPMIFPVPDDADPKEIQEHYSFEVRKNGVIVCYDKMGVQFLEADCSWTEDISSYEYRFHIQDYSNFDSDSYCDLFVTEKIGTPDAPTRGKYFRFDSDTGLFEPWDELNAISLQVHSSLNSHLERRLSTSFWENHARETKIYEWQNGKLVMIEREYMYPVESENPEDKTYYSNSFSYVNGYEELYQREKLVYVNHAECPVVTEIPIE
ncbi:MAG: hypothetical protein K2H89_09205 [Oscillospiraceae bacterium]|nr:hypothetical protein [Oscillospiraceae bacterium]